MIKASQQNAYSNTELINALNSINGNTASQSNYFGNKFNDTISYLSNRLRPFGYVNPITSGTAAVSKTGHKAVDLISRLNFEDVPLINQTPIKSWPQFIRENKKEINDIISSPLEPIAITSAIASPFIGLEMGANSFEGARRILRLVPGARWLLNNKYSPKLLKFIGRNLDKKWKEPVHDWLYNHFIQWPTNLGKEAIGMGKVPIGQAIPPKMKLPFLARPIINARNALASPLNATKNAISPYLTKAYNAAGALVNSPMAARATKQVRNNLLALSIAYPQLGKFINSSLDTISPYLASPSNIASGIKSAPKTINYILRGIRKGFLLPKQFGKLRPIVKALNVHNLPVVGVALGAASLYAGVKNLFSGAHRKSQGWQDVPINFNDNDQEVTNKYTARLIPTVEPGKFSTLLWNPENTPGAKKSLYSEENQPVYTKMTNAYENYVRRINSLNATENDPEKINQEKAKLKRDYQTQIINLTNIVNPGTYKDPSTYEIDENGNFKDLKIWEGSSGPDTAITHALLPTLLRKQEQKYEKPFTNLENSFKRKINWNEAWGRFWNRLDHYGPSFPGTYKGNIELDKAKQYQKMLDLRQAERNAENSAWANPYTQPREEIEKLYSTN